MPRRYGRGGAFALWIVIVLLLHLLGWVLQSLFRVPEVVG